MSSLSGPRRFGHRLARAVGALVFLAVWVTIAALGVAVAVEA